MPFLILVLCLMTSVASAQTLFPSGLVSVGEHAKVVFAVDKGRHLLRVYEFNQGHPRLLSEYPSDAGKKTGDKEKANDFKTPTGIYFLQRRMTQPEIPYSLYGSIAFATDYPNIFDQRDAKSGSGIWLHAVPDSIPLTRGSRGCVVVRDDVIKKLASLVSLRETPLVIFDHLDEVPEADFDKERAQFFGFFEEWRKSWETEDVDNYIRFYDSTFKNAQMNYKQWYNHKKKLKGLYSFIKVKLSDPLIVRNRNQVVIRTFQSYESDKHRDYGLKTIHARYSPESGFKIIREDWEPRERIELPKQATEVETKQHTGMIDQASHSN